MPAALLTQLNPIWPYPPMNFIEALTRSAREMGYRLAVYQQDETMPPERLQQILWQTGVEALLIGPVFDVRIFDRLPWPQFSVLAVGSGHFVPPCHWVTLDVGRALWDILNRCLERGYRRMALVDYLEPQGPADAFERMGAIGWARHRARREGWSFEVFETLPKRESAVLEALRTFHPDAIIGQTPSIWFALKDWMSRSRQRIGFVAWRLDPPSLPYRLCGFSEDLTPLAAYAIRVLDAEVRAFQRGLPQVPVKQLVPMRWIEGDSLPARRKPRSAPGRVKRTRASRVG